MIKTIKKVAAFIFIFATFGLTAFGQKHSQSVTYQKVKVGHVTANVIAADLKSGHVVFDLYVASHHPSNRSFPHETFKSMIRKTQPTAAINGTYYDTRTFIPVGTLAADGRMFQTGTHGISICFTHDSQVEFYKIKDLRNFPWKKFKVVISTGPTLVENGKVHLYPRAEKFRDPDVFGSAKRSAIGITKNKKLLLVTVSRPIGLRGMAWVMKKLGADHAVCLDGGSSTALYYRGDYLNRPSRLLTNIFLIYDEKEARISKE